MKKRLFVLLTLTLLAVLAMMTTALAENCPACGFANPDEAHFCVNCGGKMENVCGHCGTELPKEARFCHNCGKPCGTTPTPRATATPRPTKTPTPKPTKTPTPKPTATPYRSTVSITGATRRDDGTVTLRWTDYGNNGPYEVRYELEGMDGGSFYWYNETSAKSYTFEWLVPGRDYTFTVVDDNGGEVEYYYDAPYVSTYNEIGTKMDMKLKAGSSGNKSTVTRFYVSDITNTYSNKSHGLYVKLSYSQLARAREYYYRLAVEAPNGLEEVIRCGTLTLPAGRSSLSAWDFISLDEHFELQEKYFDEVVSGTYIVTLYYNNYAVLSESFYVSR